MDIRCKKVPNNIVCVSVENVLYFLYFFLEASYISSYLAPPKLVIFEGMGSPSDLVEYTYETLDSLTGGFSAENYIGSTQYGEVFRGKIHEGMETREVVVKRWVKPSNVKTWPRFSARLEVCCSKNFL